MTEEELARLTPEERARLAAAEQEALSILKRQLNEGRREPRRHQRFALAVFVFVAVLALVLMGIAWLVTRFSG